MQFYWLISENALGCKYHPDYRHHKACRSCVTDAEMYVAGVGEECALMAWVGRAVTDGNMCRIPYCMSRAWTTLYSGEFYRIHCNPGCGNDGNTVGYHVSGTANPVPHVFPLPCSPSIHAVLKRIQTILQSYPLVSHPGYFFLAAVLYIWVGGCEIVSWSLITPLISFDCQLQEGSQITRIVNELITPVPPADLAREHNLNEPRTHIQSCCVMLCRHAPRRCSRSSSRSNRPA